MTLRLVFSFSKLKDQIKSDGTINTIGYQSIHVSPILGGKRVSKHIIRDN